MTIKNISIATSIMLLRAMETGFTHKVDRMQIDPSSIEDNLNSAIDFDHYHLENLRLVP
jgi:hypothetical protein